ncbi:hypothetical protein OIO90_005471 [Microbotryomycetes sp. JL221]|nr:hypothetical protein OIO90_005471 [Microbotryomycetes sp. JL221]
MLPHQRQKVDLSSLTDQERELFQKYGKLPSHKGLLANKLKERKYFDSGDYAMSKAGVSPQHVVGTAIPSPADIPHASPPSTNPVPISGGSTQPGSTVSTSPSSSFVIGQQGNQASTSPTTVGVGHPIGAGTFGSPSKEPIGTFGGRMQ